MVALAYRGWSFTRGSNSKALTGNVLVSWIGSRLGRRSHTEVRLYPQTVEDQSILRRQELYIDRDK